MEKKVIFFVLALVLFSALSSNIFAAQAIPLPPQPNLNPSFLGETQYYTVDLRGNGETVISAKFILGNQTNYPLNQVSLNVPRVKPQDLIVYQVIREPQCILYEPNTTTCAKYQEPDYYNYWGPAKYEKAGFTLKGDTVVVNLPTPIQSNANGSFMIYYRALGYTKKNLFGAYNYVFTTLKVEDRIRTVQVGVMTDSDLYLEGQRGTVNYKFTSAPLSAESLIVRQGAAANTQLDNFYQQIGQGTIVKTASDLQPGESYTVKGSYADSALKVYANKILAGIGVVFLALILVIFIFKALFKNIPSRNLLLIILTSFLAALVVFGYTVLVFFIRVYFNTTGYNYELVSFFDIFMAFSLIGVYAIFLILPAVVLGIKKGVWFGIGQFVATIVWLMFYFAVTLLILVASGSFAAPGVGQPVPFIKGSAPASSSTSDQMN